MHAASVGEAMSVLVLIRRLVELSPSLNVLVTTGTVTSARLMAERLPAGIIHQFVPVDRPAWVRRFLDHWRPDVALWVESEFWPNLITETARRGVPIALVNGRMSDRSYRNWQRFSAIAAGLLTNFELVLAQDDTVAEKLTDLGATNVMVTGSLKFAADPLPYDVDEFQRLAAVLDGRPRWLAASTHDDEEISVIAAHRLAVQVNANLLTIIVPRHPSRGSGLVDEMRRGGLRVAQRSAGDEIKADTQIYLADTIGELGLFYRLAELVFVGGSLVPRGCQNLIEPAQLGCAILHGPDTSNFRIAAEDLQAAGAALRVADRGELSHQVSVLLADDARRQKMIHAARVVASEKHEVIDTVVAALTPIIGRVDVPATAELGHART